MKKQLIAAAATAGIALGGFGVAGLAGAQDYSADPVVDTGSSTIVQVQAETDGTNGADAEGEGRQGRRGHRHAKFEAIAEVIGMDVEDIREARMSGQSLAQIAEANGVDPQAVVDVMLTGIEERLAERVAEGDMTQAEADEKLAGAEERIEEKINSTELGRRGRGGPRNADLPTT